MNFFCGCYKVQNSSTPNQTKYFLYHNSWVIDIKVRKDPEQESDDQNSKTKI